MLSRREEKLVRSLRRRKAREAEGLFLAEGVRVVEELLDAGIVPRLAVVSSSLEDTPRGRALRERLTARVPVREVGGGELAGLADTEHPQGVVVVAELPRVDGAEAAPAERASGAAVLVLDGVQDPGNLGTLIRTAAAFGVGRVACLPGTVDPWNPKSVRASAGASFRLDVVQTELEPLLTWLAEREYVLLGADAAGPPVSERALPARVALVVGNEGAGLSPPVRSRVAGLISVPMEAATESLNVAVAGAILLYTITRERG